MLKPDTTLSAPPFPVALSAAKKHLGSVDRYRAYGLFVFGCRSPRRDPYCCTQAFSPPGLNVLDSNSCTRHFSVTV
jgi:hypothetical protein